MKKFLLIALLVASGNAYAAGYNSYTIVTTSGPITSTAMVNQLTPNLLDQSIGQLVLPTERDCVQAVCATTNHEIRAAIVFAPGMTRQDDYHWKMDAPEQAKWLATHIPHRVRAAIARLPMENSILRAKATIGLKVLDEKQLLDPSGDPGTGAIVSIAKACYTFTRAQKEALALANLADSVESIIGMLPS